MATHPAEIREQALAKLRDGLSYRTVAAELGVSVASLSRWAKAAGITPERAAQTAAAAVAAGEAHRRKWAERKADLVDELGAVAAELLDKARAAGARDAQAFMTAVAIGVDKAQLLSGGVTSRHEQLDAQRRRTRVEEIADEIAQR
jgi:transcriptional regulator with XRE-family HTH domain